jgi:hypothetical protein
MGTVDNYDTGPAARFTISNSGGEPVTALAISTSNQDFLIPPGGQQCGPTLAAGSFCSVWVQFRPRASFRELGALNASGLTDGGPVKAVATLAGHPRLPISVSPSPLPGSFVSAVGQTSAPQTFTVTNHGVGPTGLLAFELAGTNGSDWIVDAGTCAAPIPGGGTCQFSLAFRPLAWGPRTALFSISAVPGGRYLTNLSGTGN